MSVPPVPASNAAPNLAFPIDNRFNPRQDGATTESKLEFRQVARKPPRDPSNSKAATFVTGKRTSTVRSRRGSEFGRGDGTASRPRTPHPNLSFAPQFVGPSPNGLNELYKRVETIRKIREEADMEENVLHEELWELWSAGLAETQEWVNRAIDFSPGSPSIKRLDVKTPATHASLGPQNKRSQEPKQDLVEKTPVLGGLVYSSAIRPERPHEAGIYRNSTPVRTPLNDARPDIFVHQAMTRERLEVHNKITSNGQSVSPKPYQVSRKMYHTPKTPGFASLPPRPQRIPLHHQSLVQNKRTDVFTVSWPPELPPKGVPGNPPPRSYPHDDDVSVGHEFEGVTLSPNCSYVDFFDTYWRKQGCLPNEAAREAWRRGVGKEGIVKQKQRYEDQRALEQEVKKRHVSESGQKEWSSNLGEGPSGPTNHEYLSSSDASRKGETSRESVAGDEGCMVINDAGSDKRGGIKVPRAGKWWKDIDDMTWAFGNQVPDEV